MTIKQLIELLKKYPEDQDVFTTTETEIVSLTEDCVYVYKVSPKWKSSAIDFRDEYLIIGSKDG